MCPKGDNPETDNQNYHSIILTVTGPLNFGGSLGFTFQGETTFLEFPNLSTNTIQTLLESSNKFKSIKCSYSNTNSGTSTHIITITFVAWPILPQENNLYTHNGNPSLTDFTCDTSLMSSSVSCTFTNNQISNLQGMLIYLLFII